MTGVKILRGSLAGNLRRFLGESRWQGVLLALAVLASQASGGAQTAPRFDVTKYTIEAQLFPSTHVLSAKAKIEFLPLADLTTLSFELHGGLRVEKVVGPEGQELRFRQERLTLQVDFLNPQLEGKPSSITVHYGGPLATTDRSPVENLKLAYVGSEGTYLLYPGRWFPVNAPGTDRFAATMRITVPSEQTVVASGKPVVPVRQTGKVTYIYEFNQPAFPGTVLAGRYVVTPATTAGADIALYLKPGHENFAAPYGEAAAKIMAFFSDRFAPLPSGHLALVEIDDGTVGGFCAPGIVALPRVLSRLRSITGSWRTRSLTSGGGNW